MTTENEKSPAPDQTSEAVHQRSDPKVDSPSADPVAKINVDAPADARNETSSKLGIGRGNDNELRPHFSSILSRIV
ncbi:hypothetical protein [Burkholderia dolosa]|uniref:hypothetical protein n=1 Tax=Burkholderia dolosa TaxID=152500 RepID=UPI001B9C8573|nr:hypothetical protein [Burkholderia dolosa]MBR8059221.1 hypothetical protein [Burkholderia dolosa]